MPKAAKQRTPDGAKAFVEYWFKVVNEIPMRTGPGDVYAISAKECIACKNFIESMKSYYKDSGETVGLPLFELEIYTTDPAPDKPQFMIVNFEFRRLERTLFRDGKITNEKTKSASAKARAQLEWMNESWQMYDVE